LGIEPILANLERSAGQRFCGKVFDHDQGSQMSRDAISHERSIAQQVKFVLAKEDRANRPELHVAQKILGARPGASAEVTFDLMTVASRDRIAMSQAPITPTKRNMR
jgi:hypothetical protein